MLCKRNIIILSIIVSAGFLISGLGFKIMRAVAHKIERKLHAPKRYGAVNPAVFKDGAAVFIASSLDRVFEDGKTTLKPDFSLTCAVSLAKNEYESFQVIVQTKGRSLSAVNLDVSDLVNAKTGARIDKTNISWRVVGYVPTKTPYYPVKFVGRWPDPLWPAHKVDIPTDTTQSFWVTIYAPVSTGAGDYTGHVTIVSEHRVLGTIPMAVRIYDFVLPKENHLKTAFDFYGHLTKQVYPLAEREENEDYKSRLDDLNDQFIVMMIKYRMHPILNIDPASQEDRDRIDRYRGFGLNNFAIGKKGGTFDNNWPKDDTAIEKLLPMYRGYAEALKAHQMLKYTYIYTWDEGPIGNPLVPKIAEMIHRADPGLRNMVCYHGFWDPAEFPHWGKDIDIWTFQIDNFDQQKMRKLQNLGKEIWMYISGPCGTTAVPNLGMDFDSIDYRIIPWLCWKFDIQGFLYWCVNWWQGDPFKTAHNAKWRQNGVGVLFYPGKDAPLASLRAEIFRDGMEDYEYMQLLLSKIQIIKQRNLTPKYRQYFDESVENLTMDDAIVKAMGNFTKDGQVLKARRNAIAQKIEEFTRLDLDVR